MASVMAGSEVGFVLCCYVSSKKIVPQIRVAREFVTKKAIPELVRFGGSYQLVNVLEVLYASILPVAILRAFGADSAGIYAIAIRLVSSAVMLSDSFLVPVLSGGAMVYASGAQDEMRKLITKSFKITLGLCLFPLAFIAFFGPTMIFAWTGQTAASLRVALWLVCAAGFFQAFSVLGLVLYRVSGNALLDNIRQGLRIVCLLAIAAFSRQLGFYGVLAGLALTEFAGMLFMLYAITKTFQAFHPRSLLPDAVKLTVASVAVLVAGGIATRIPLPAIAGARWMAVLDLGKVLLACLVAAWPALALTKSVTGAESKALISIVRPRKVRADQSLAESVT
jgi:O-antigen/teichoic acid export membrane protein